MLPNPVKRLVEEHLETPITGSESVGGGCIANATRVDTASGPFFLKWSTDDVASTFRPEARGLEVLRGAESPLVVPAVLFVRDREDGEPGLLLTEWVESGRQGSGFWEHFGRGLAQMHRHESDCYGFDRDNFIGRLPQRNAPTNRWPDFFATCRLGPQVQVPRVVQPLGHRHSEKTTATGDQNALRIFGHALDPGSPRRRRGAQRSAEEEDERREEAERAAIVP